MKSSIVAIRYAKAFYDFAVEKNKTSTFISECEFLYQLVNESVELRQLLKFSPYSLQKRKEILLELIKNSSEIALKMFDLLALNNRLDIIQEISNQVIKIDYQAKGIIKVNVTTAIKLDETLINQVHETINKIVKGPVELSNRIDSKIIGGFIINFKDLQYDASIANKVKDIKNTIVQA